MLLLQPAEEETKNWRHASVLKPITAKKETLIDLTVIEILSRHASDEFYLGQRDGGDY